MTCRGVLDSNDACTRFGEDNEGFGWVVATKGNHFFGATDFVRQGLLLNPCILDERQRVRWGIRVDSVPRIPG